MNKELENLYNSKWSDLCKALKPIVEGEQHIIKPTYPLLIDIAKWENGAPSEKWYSDAEIRVMIFGQETNKWTLDAKDANADCDDFGIPPSPIFDPEISMGAVSGLYANFYTTHYLGNKFNFNDRYGTFHYGFSQLVSLLNQKYEGKRIGYVWNNIVKFGKSVGKGFDNNIYSVEQQLFSVIPQEIEILKPHIIIFLTGTYDDKIKDNFGDVTFTPVSSFSEKEVAKVELPNFGTAYRTYHPSAIMQKDRREAYYNAIVDSIDLAF